MAVKVCLVDYPLPVALCISSGRDWPHFHVLKLSSSASSAVSSAVSSSVQGSLWASLCNLRLSLALTSSLPVSLRAEYRDYIVT